MSYMVIIQMLRHKKMKINIIEARVSTVRWKEQVGF